MDDRDIPTKTLEFATRKRRSRDTHIECRRRVPIQVLRDAILARREKDLLVYLVLATYQDMRGPWFRLRKDVQNALGLPPRTRATYLKRLKDAGCIELRRAPGECYEVSVLSWAAWLVNAPEIGEMSVSE